jgi:hypothetical protein
MNEIKLENENFKKEHKELKRKLIENKYEDATSNIEYIANCKQLKNEELIDLKSTLENKEN